MPDREPDPPAEPHPRNAREPTSTFRWWLRLQVWIAVGGGSVWVVGAVIEHDFVAGVGCGLLIGALVLRFGRRAAEKREGIERF